MRRRRLATALRHLREQAELDLDDVVEATKFSKAKISRIETAAVGVSAADTQTLCRLYGLDEQTTGRLVNMARESRRRGWWARHALGVAGHFEWFIETESEATGISNFEIDLIPGLLQTDEYVHALARAWDPDLSASVLDARTNVRLRRQDRLTGDDPVRLWAIVDEAALRRPVGGTGVMQRQLRHLLEAARLPNVTFQVLPFEAGAHAAMGVPFCVLAADAADDVVYVEHLTGGVYVESTDEVGRYKLKFEYLKASALSPQSSAAFVADFVN